MNPNANLWVAALRSGEYPQTKTKYATLKEPDGYTALGVLCELALRRGMIERYDAKGAMPLGVQVWVGWRVPYCSPLDFDKMQERQVSFAIQAGLIEAYADRLFDE